MGKKKISEFNSATPASGDKFLIEQPDGTYKKVDFDDLGSGVQSVTGPNVDNTDPANPVVNPLTQNLQDVTDNGANTTNQMQINGVNVATVNDIPSLSGYVDTAGLTTNTIPKATASDTIGDSSITDDGTTVTVNSPTVITSDNSNNQIISIDNLKALVAHDVKILFNSPIYSFANMQANETVETDASKNLVSVAKGTAYNKDFGTGTANIAEIGSTLGNTKPVITSSSGKLQTSDWVNIVSSCTFVGWSSYTTQEVDVIDMGAYYMLHVLVVGTSNSATTSIQLPYTSLGSNNGAGLFANNGTTIIGRWIFTSGSNTITFGTSAISAVWAAYGTKYVGMDIFFKK